MRSYVSTRPLHKILMSAFCAARGKKKPPHDVGLKQATEAMNYRSKSSCEGNANILISFHSKNRFR